jgi:hypothetical protein
VALQAAFLIGVARHLKIGSEISDVCQLAPPAATKPSSLLINLTASQMAFSVCDAARGDGSVRSTAT